LPVTALVGREEELGTIVRVLDATTERGGVVAATQTCSNRLARPIDSASKFAEESSSREPKRRSSCASQ
jgi:hypothetical protein